MRTVRVLVSCLTVILAGGWSHGAGTVPAATFHPGRAVRPQRVGPATPRTPASREARPAPRRSGTAAGAVPARPAAPRQGHRAVVELSAGYGSRSAPALVDDFEGMAYTGKTPADTTVASGPSNVVVATNDRVRVMDRSGNVLVERTLADWFASVSPPGQIKAPRVLYDRQRDRWLLVARSEDSQAMEAVLLISASDTGDPAGMWWTWKVDASMAPDGTPKRTYPCTINAGYDGDPHGAVHVSTTQCLWMGVTSHARDFLFRKDELYTGSALNYLFTDPLEEADGEVAQRMAPAVTWGSDEYGVQWMARLGTTERNKLYLWYVLDGGGSSPTIYRWGYVPIADWTYPHEARQPDTDKGLKLDWGVLGAELVNQRLHVVFNEEFDGGSGPVQAYRWVTFDVPTGEVVDDTTYYNPDADFYYPHLAVDLDGNAYVGLSVSGPNEYAGAWYAGRYATETRIGDVTSYYRGTSAYDNPTGGVNWWGKYSGAWMDADGSGFVANMAATGLEEWTVWVGHIDHSAGKPTEDEYEENDDRAHAATDLADLPNRWLSTVNGMGIHRDDDWFALDVRESDGRDLTIECRFKHVQENLDLELYDGGGTLLAAGNTTTDNEKIEYTLPAAGRYYVRVLGAANAGHSYDLIWRIDRCTDADGDGHCAEDDCDDSDTNNWDSCDTCKDEDGDSYYAGCDRYETIDGPDCDDGDETIHPDATETTCDGVDQDCDGLADDHPDADGDGYDTCAPGDPGDGDGKEADCDDADGSVNPGAEEVCDDGIDNDCDGDVDADDEDCLGDLEVADIRFTAGKKDEITWDAGSRANRFGVYRGVIRPGGFEYDHRCIAAGVHDRRAVISRTPSPGRALYYLVEAFDASSPDWEAGGTAGPEGQGRRPDQWCGKRLYVDPDATGAADGSSWEDAYTKVSAALEHEYSRGRPFTIWIRRDIGDDEEVVIEQSARFVGGFDGTESEPWERSLDTPRTTWSVPMSFGYHDWEYAHAFERISFADGIRIPVEWQDEHYDFVVTECDFGVDGGLTFRAPTDHMHGADVIVENSSFGGGTEPVLDMASDGDWLDVVVRNCDVQRDGGTAVLLEYGGNLIVGNDHVEIVGNRFRGAATGIRIAATSREGGGGARYAGTIAANVFDHLSGTAINLGCEVWGHTEEEKPNTCEITVDVVGNTFVDNGGHGVKCEFSPGCANLMEGTVVRCEPRVWNNVFSGNGGYALVEAADTGWCTYGDPEFVGNDLYGNGHMYLDEGTTTLDDIDEVNALAEARENVSVEPGFVDPAGGDYHLRSDSALIDAGVAGFPGTWFADMDGECRLLDGDHDGTARPDIGADEVP